MQDLRSGLELANRYSLVRKLGSGGAAQTWLARDRVTRTSVALKILDSDRVTTETFRKDWHTAIRLVHAHIARVFEFHDEDPPFYSMQYVAGGDMSLLAGAPLAHILPVAGLVADALRYAHARDVVHRDIKAANVLFDANGAPYVVDFGVAALRGDTADGGSLIAASPQSLAGEPAHPSDDIFALGGLMYELISGASPYSSADTRNAIISGEPAPLSSAAGDEIPDAIRQLIARMLDKDASRRPDAEGVTEVLRAAGFTPGPAPGQYLESTAAADDEIIEVDDVPRRAPRASRVKSREPAKESSGVSPRVLGIALLVLITVLLGVVFLLPKTVGVDDDGTVAQESAQVAGDKATGEKKPGVAFSENVEDLSGRDERVQSRASTETVLGELLSMLETLDNRAVQRWGGLRYRQAREIYAEGDAAYLERDYALATEKYREAIEIVEPLLEQVDAEFSRAFDAGMQALEVGDTIEALRNLELAVAISSGHAGAQAGLERARNLDTVLSLTDQGIAFEKNLELEGARQSFQQAIALDPEWQPAREGLDRVEATINQMDFDQRMSEGLEALAVGDFASARAAFRMAEALQPGSVEPRDGLMQVDQGLRLERIARLERQAASEQAAEKWEAAIESYETILEIDPNLSFAQEGLSHAQQMTALHGQLAEFIAEPDKLSAQSTMNRATRLVVEITRMGDIGPRLADERDQLSRLLKRAATPIPVRLVSDNLTSVSIFKVGKLGNFEPHELNLRPGTYVATGSRPGYRDVRLEFRVAPEKPLEPIVVRCEETI
jgi:tetratricopeptide (TPR) repeat protein